MRHVIDFVYVLHSARSEQAISYARYQSLFAEFFEIYWNDDGDPNMTSREPATSMLCLILSINALCLKSVPCQIMFDTLKTFIAAENRFSR